MSLTGVAVPLTTFVVMKNTANIDSAVASPSLREWSNTENVAHAEIQFESHARPGELQIGRIS